MNLRYLKDSTQATRCIIKFYLIARFPTAVVVFTLRQCVLCRWAQGNGFGFCQNLAKKFILAKLDALAAFTHARCHLLAEATGWCW